MWSMQPKNESRNNIGGIRVDYGFVGGSVIKKSPAKAIVYPYPSNIVPAFIFRLHAPHRS